MKKLFVAATRQDDGKSTFCLGLLQALRRGITQIGFMKPVGQHYVKRDGCEVDEDVVLMKDVCQIEDNLVDMNPIVIKKGFTEEYIERGDRKELSQKIQTSFDRISHGKQLILIEGTGHAGVGAVIDLSNASVAKLLGAKVLILSFFTTLYKTNELSLPPLIGTIQSYFSPLFLKLFIISSNDFTPRTLIGL